VIVWPHKDPDEVLDFGIDWSVLLEGDTISTSEWIVPAGITKDSDSYSTASTTIWLSGGESGQLYALTNRVTTAGARSMDETVSLRVKPR
jgi:hypothetical protein